ncbi:MAG TPA: hypothetical protein PLY97_06995, partial [Acidocella sp.]|nr:hypothetical protein [Acidocella sp.]
YFQCFSGFLSARAFGLRGASNGFGRSDQEQTDKNFFDLIKAASHARVSARSWAGGFAPVHPRTCGPDIGVWQ